MKLPSQRQAIIEIIFAGALWGFGFIATKFALESFGPLQLNLVRFVISCAVIFPLIYLVGAFRTQKHAELFKISILPGIFLSALMIFQTWGLRYTSATKSGFITTLYIVMVPIFEVMFLQKKLRYEHVFWVTVALFGTALICDFQGGEWNLGDFLTFLCAIAASLHIIFISKISSRIDSPMAFNGYQSLVCAVVTGAACLLWGETTTDVYTTPAILGLLYLVIASTTLAFMLQVRAQQVVSASTASLLFLLESPFAAVFGFLFLGEALSIHQWIGGALILISALLSVR